MTSQMSTITGLATFRIINQDLALTVIPGLGGKICSIAWRGRELLAQNPRKPLRPARYAAPYADYDASGFDECFPTIGPCAYPDYPWQGAELPDHGEVWSLPWEVLEAGETRLHLRVSGVRIPYIFEKWIELSGPGSVHFQYTLENPTAFPFRYLWSAHPLIGPRPGMRICLPESVRVRVDWSKDGRLGALLDEHPWPLTVDRLQNPVDLSLILEEDAGLVDKLYTTPLPEGWCGVYDPADGLYTGFVFSPDQIPYVGLSINLGGWPVDGPGYYNLGLEPCIGYPDRLDLAMDRGACAVLEPRQPASWEMELVVGEAPDQQAAMADLARLSGTTGSS